MVSLGLPEEEGMEVRKDLKDRKKKQIIVLQSGCFKDSSNVVFDSQVVGLNV